MQFRCVFYRNPCDKMLKKKFYFVFFPPKFVLTLYSSINISLRLYLIENMPVFACAANLTGAIGIQWCIVVLDKVWLEEIKTAGVCPGEKSRLDWGSEGWRSPVKW